MCLSSHLKKGNKEALRRSPTQRHQREAKSKPQLPATVVTTVPVQVKISRGGSVTGMGHRSVLGRRRPGGRRRVMLTVGICGGSGGGVDNRRDN